MVTLPGMRPNLFPNAENAKPPFGRVSAVSSVNSPIVPVVASIGVNFGAGLLSSFVFFLSVAVVCAGREGTDGEVASEAPVSLALAESDEAGVSEGEVADAGSSV